jgi:hypothetical protein
MPRLPGVGTPFGRVTMRGAVASSLVRQLGVDHSCGSILMTPTMAP